MKMVDDGVNEGYVIIETNGNRRLRLNFYR